MGNKVPARVVAWCVLVATAAVILSLVVIFSRTSLLLTAPRAKRLAHEEWTLPVDASPERRLQVVPDALRERSRYWYTSMERAGSNELAVLLIRDPSSMSMGSKEPIPASFLLFSLKTDSVVTSTTVLLNKNQRYQYPSSDCPPMRDIQGPFKVGEEWFVVFDPDSGLAVSPNPAYAFSSTEPTSHVFLPVGHENGFLAIAADASGMYAVPYPKGMSIGERRGKRVTGRKTVPGEVCTLDSEGNTLLSTPLRLNYSSPKGMWALLYGFGIELKLTDQHVFILNRVPCLFFATEQGYWVSANPRLDVYDKRLTLLNSVELPVTNVTGLFYSMDVDVDTQRILVVDSYTGRAILYNFALELLRTFNQLGNFGIWASFEDFIIVGGKVYVLDGTGALNVFDLGLSVEEEQ